LLYIYIYINKQHPERIHQNTPKLHLNSKKKNTYQNKIHRINNLRFNSRKKGFNSQKNRVRAFFTGIKSLKKNQFNSIKNEARNDKLLKVNWKLINPDDYFHEEKPS
jgi:hypothetical protein